MTFSVVIPAYNAEETLAQTLRAVETQTFTDWECVVVDDGSTDATRRIASDFADKEIRIRVFSQENQGSAGAYNTGCSHARGEFVVLCSADDLLLPSHLSEMAEFIAREPQFDIYSSNGYYWREDGSRQLVYSPPSHTTVESWALSDVIANCFYSVGATYRRSWFTTVGGYRLGIFGEDYDFWLRAMASGATHRYLPCALSLHRISPTQKSANLERAYRSDIRIVTDLREQFALSALELDAVKRCIRDRERLIALQSAGPLRRLLMRIVGRLSSSGAKSRTGD